MKDPSLVKRVEELLAAGRTQRSIAREEPISRGTVSKIARGLWRGRKPGSRRSAIGTQELGPPIHCECGGRFYADGHSRCRACRLKDLQRRTGMRIKADGDAGPLEIGLLPRERQRYEGLRARKLAENRQTLADLATLQALELDDEPEPEFEPLEAEALDFDVLDAFEAEPEVDFDVLDLPVMEENEP